MAGYESQGYLVSAFDFDYPFQPSPLYSASTASDLTLIGDQQFTPPAYHIGDISPPPPKRQRISTPQHSNHNSKGNTQMTALATTELAEERGPITAAANKPKRVRTGCLTCRERHLKCDEGEQKGSELSADVHRADW